MCQIAIGKGHFCFLSKSSLKKEKKSDKNTPKRYYESDISIIFFSLFSSLAPRYQTLHEV